MKPSQLKLERPAIGKLGEKITSLSIKDKSDRSILNNQSSFIDYTLRNITVHQPVYTLSEAELLKGEEILFKIAIKIYVEGKSVKYQTSTSETIQNISSVLAKIAGSKLTDGPWNSHMYDGVMFVTNQRVIFRFIDQFKNLEKDYPLRDLKLSLGNTQNKDRLSRKLNEIESPETHPYLSVNDGELKVWLLTEETYRSNSNTHYYYIFAGYNMYVGLTLALKGIEEFMRSANPSSFVSKDFEEGIDWMYGKKGAGMWVIYLFALVFILFACGLVSAGVLSSTGNEEIAGYVGSMLCFGFIGMFALAFFGIIGLSIYSRIRRKSDGYKKKVDDLMSKTVEFS